MMTETTAPAAACPVVIGQALYASAQGLTWVAAIEPEKAGVALLIGGPSPMSTVRWRIVAVSSDAKRYTMDEHTAAARADAGNRYPDRSPAEVAELLAKADQMQADGIAKAQADSAAREVARGEARELLATYRPSWAEAAIIAELHEDRSDSQSDYHNHIVTRTVVLAWSTHKRDLFAEMRKSAALLPETAHLATASEKAEHREKYSMGAGYYLKDGYRDDNGWCVKKCSAGSLDVPGLSFTDEAKRGWFNNADKAKPEPAATIAGAGLFSIEEHTHTKKGFQMFIAIMGDRVERETFTALLDAARTLGGWYTKPWGGTPGGFAFKDEAKARQFVADHGEGDATPSAAGEVRAPVAPRAPAPGIADKLRKLADGMQGQVDNGFRDRETNTPRKARMAAGARIEGVQWERAQKIARALADAHDAGTVPAVLGRVSTKAELYDLANEEKDHGGGYYDAPRLLGRVYDWRDDAKNAKAAAAWGLLSVATDPARVAAEELRTKLDALRFAKIPGYFPTPAALIAQMIERALLPDGADVLEPSAGSGAIADAVRAAGHEVTCIERHASLAAILRLKGHKETQADFMEIIAQPLYDAVLMNPPFEKGQDCEHVRHAFEFLKPGGALVAIMGAGVTFRQGKPYAPFRDWLDDLGGELVEIPAGAFKESGTGVASVMVIVTKED